MKFIIAVSSILALAAAAPSLLVQSPTFYAAPAHVISQYHAQDELGQYSYGYNGGLSAKAETKSLDGVTRGSYSYVDAEGTLQTVSYSADAVNGFRAAATNLPVAPVDDRVAPEAVKETPEVAQATAEHLAAVEDAKLRNAAAEKEEEAPIVEVKSLPIAAPITTYAAAPIAAPITAYAAGPIAAYAPSSFAYSTSQINLAGAPAAYTYHSAPVVALRSAELPTSYSYNIQTPAYAYNIGSPYIAAPYGYHYAAGPAPVSVIAARSAVPTIDALPEAVKETPEVAQAREEHLAAHAEAKARNLQ